MNCYAEYNISPVSTGLPEKAGKVVVTADVSLSKIADVLNMDIADLQALNPQYKQGIVRTSEGVATLLLPSDKVKCFTDNASQLYENNKAPEEQKMEMAARIVKGTIHNQHS